MKKNDSRKGQKPIQIWVDDKLHDDLAYIAEAQERPLAYMCRLVLKNYAKKEKK